MAEPFCQDRPLGKVQPVGSIPSCSEPKVTLMACSRPLSTLSLPAWGSFGHGGCQHLEGGRESLEGASRRKHLSPFSVDEAGGMHGWGAPRGSEEGRGQACPSST